MGKREMNIELSGVLRDTTLGFSDLRVWVDTALLDAHDQGPPNSAVQQLLRMIKDALDRSEVVCQTTNSS